MRRHGPNKEFRKCKRLLTEARKVNDKRDVMDFNFRRAAPSTCPMDQQLTIVLSALFYGIEHEDWGTVAEAAAMLQDAEVIARMNRDRPQLLPTIPLCISQVEDDE